MPNDVCEKCGGVLTDGKCRDCDPLSTAICEGEPPIGPGKPNAKPKPPLIFLIFFYTAIILIMLTISALCEATCVGSFSRLLLRVLLPWLGVDVR